jgi:Outer membrane protein beta-barrel family
MFKPTLLSFLFSILTLWSLAQSRTISGSVGDTTEEISLTNAAVALLRAADSGLVTFTRAKPDGKFLLTAPADGKYILLITYPGYADHADFLEINGPADLGNINMLTKAVVLQNVIVRASAVRMKGDTLSFAADSFKVSEGATVEDLLKRLPGLSVNNKGEITAQGQKVEKVLVDGDEFFGDDPTLATRNLQALAVKEVQVFDKKSDQATFTGVDDGQSQKTINLKLKDDFKKGYFGKVKLGGGLPNRWENQAMINAFKDKRKLSVYGVMSNTNNNSLGWSEESQFGGNLNTNMEIGDDGSVMMWSQGDEFGGTGGYYGEGLPQSMSIGTSYANKWNENRSNVNGAYRFQRMRTEANTTVTTQNILPDTQFYNNEKGRNIAERWRNKAQIKSEIFIDSMQSLTFSLSGSYGENNIYNEYISEALNGKQLPVNQSSRTTNADGIQSQFSASALYKLKFKKARRTLSISFSDQFNQNETEGFLLTYNQFYNEQGLFRKDTVDQRKDNFSRGNSISGKVAYTEPVGKKGIVEINYSYGLTKSDQTRLSYDREEGKDDVLNEVFSNDFRFETKTQRAGTGYRFNGKKIQFGFGGDIAFTDWQQDDLFRDTTRLYDFTNFFPRANFSYKLGQFSRISMNYNGNTTAPSANQLQPVADNNDPLNIMIGNPNLVQSFNHRISLNYNFWKVLTNSGFWSSFWFNPTSNDFSTRDVVDQFGRRVSQTVNVKGNYNFGGYVGYDFKWKKPDISINMSFDPTFNQRTNFINGIENKTVSRNVGYSVGFRKDKEKKYFISLSQGVNYNFSKSSIRPDVPTKFWTTRTGFDGQYQLPKNFSITTDLSYNWRQQTDVFDQNNNALIWNAGIEKKIIKKQDMRLGFRINDILNQNIGFQRNISSNYITERTYDVIRQYWLVTFQWNFNKGPQKAED